MTAPTSPSSPTSRHTAAFWRRWAWLFFLQFVKCPFYLSFIFHYMVQRSGFFPAILIAARDSKLFRGLAAWAESTLPLNGRDPMDTVLFVAFTCGLHILLYYSICGFFFLCDHKGWLKRYKLPRAPHMKAPWPLLRRTLLEAAKNHFLTDPIVLFVLYTRVTHFPSFFEADKHTPSITHDFFGDMLHISGMHLINEYLLYFMHRLAHEIPWVYRKFHKQHHQYVGSVGFAAEYAHPVEALFTAQIPTLGYCLLFSDRIHPVLWLCWLACRAEETYEVHSGYCFKGSFLDKIFLLNSDLAEHHDFHHTVNKGTYASEVADLLFGTMDDFHAHKAAAARKVVKAD